MSITMIDPGEWEGLECPVCDLETLNYTNFEVHAINLKGEGVQCQDVDCRFMAEHNVVGKLMEFLKLDTPEYDPADDEDDPRG